MPIVQKYHELSQKKPKENQMVLLYRKHSSVENETYYTKVFSEPVNVEFVTEHFIHFKSKNGDGFFVDKADFSEYQFVIEKELNKVQHIFGQYYLGIPFLILIVWLIYHYY